MEDKYVCENCLCDFIKNLDNCGNCFCPECWSYKVRLMSLNEIFGVYN